MELIFFRELAQGEIYFFIKYYLKWLSKGTFKIVGWWMRICISAPAWQSKELGTPRR
jgi:hypothetical protein